MVCGIQSVSLMSPTVLQGSDWGGQVPCRTGAGRVAATKYRKSTFPARVLFRCPVALDAALLEHAVVIVPGFHSLASGVASEPFSHADWLLEIKSHGFRSLVRIEHGKCRLISGNNNEFKSFRTLNESFLAGLKVARHRSPNGIRLPMWH